MLRKQNPNDRADIHSRKSLVGKYWRMIMNIEITKDDYGIKSWQKGLERWLKMNSYCYHRRSMLGSQHPNVCGQQYVTIVPGHLVTSSGLCGHEAYFWHTFIHVSVTCTYKMKYMCFKSDYWKKQEQFCEIMATLSLWSLSRNVVCPLILSYK